MSRPTPFRLKPNKILINARKRIVRESYIPPLIRDNYDIVVQDSGKIKLKPKGKIAVNSYDAVVKERDELREVVGEFMTIMLELIGQFPIPKNGKTNADNVKLTIPKGLLSKAKQLLEETR